MKSNLPSQTAEYMAMHRAAHQLLDVPRILDDPMAMRVIDSATAVALNADPEHICAGLSISPSRRAFLAARSRYAEDRLARAVSTGCEQYVMLGAGLDTYSLRCPHDNLRIFEIDHPVTQAHKMARLREAGLVTHNLVKFFAADFERKTIEEILCDANVDLSRCTVFSWLGVIQYLPQQAIAATLRYIASLPAGTEVVFDYMLSPYLHNATQRSIFRTCAPLAVANGEPFRSAFEPDKISEQCLSVGFRHTEDLSTEMMNARYCSGRSDGLKIESINRVFCAVV
jgi:methyltransferase (TIGR00027 family)